MVLGEPRVRALHAHAPLEGRRVLGGIGHPLAERRRAVGARLVQRLGRAALGIANRGERGAGHDGEEPGAERPIGREAVQGAERLDVALLEHVVGVFVIAGDPPRQTIAAPPRAAYQLGIRVPLAFANQANELAVAQRGAVGTGQCHWPQNVLRRGGGAYSRIT